MKSVLVRNSAYSILFSFQIKDPKIFRYIQFGHLKIFNSVGYDDIENLIEAWKRSRPESILVIKE